MATKSDAGARILLRLPAGLKGRLEAAARGARRSTNAEIVVRLEASLAATGEELGPAGSTSVAPSGTADGSGARAPNPTARVPSPDSAEPVAASDGRCVHELAEGAPAGWCMRPECKAARG